MNYRTAIDRVFCSGVKPDGYNGHTIRLGFTFDITDGTLHGVTEYGCFRFCNETFEHEEEAYDWLNSFYLITELRKQSVRGYMFIDSTDSIF